MSLTISEIDISLPPMLRMRAARTAIQAVPGYTSKKVGF
jgi:hypothetical protein